MQNLLERIEKYWCETMHGRVMWPIHGQYRCSTCLREYPVGFEAGKQELPPSTVWKPISIKAA